MLGRLVLGVSLDAWMLELGAFLVLSRRSLA